MFETCDDVNDDKKWRHQLKNKYFTNTTSGWPRVEAFSLWGYILEMWECFLYWLSHTYLVSIMIESWTPNFWHFHGSFLDRLRQIWKPPFSGMFHFRKTWNSHLNYFHIDWIKNPKLPTLACFSSSISTLALFPSKHTWNANFFRSWFYTT